MQTSRPVLRHQASPRSRAGSRSPALSPEGVALGGFAVFTILAVAGYGVFGLHPELLPGDPLTLKIFSVSFTFFARLQVVLGAVALFIALGRGASYAWLPAFVVVYLLSFLAEHVGTGVGIPFGGYEYTGLLGPKLGGRVPALVPLSWFVMAVPSYAFALSAGDIRGGAWSRVALGAAFLVLWDLALDPAMSFLTPYWVWEASGPYYGMPWTNLVGWFGVGVLILGAMEHLGARRWVARVGLRWHVAFYVTVMAMPLGMLVVAGSWMAVAVTGAGAAILFVLRLLLEGTAAGPRIRSSSLHRTGYS